MANQLYPLIYKPGIKRDGTSFQADFCTDCQWVRFQRGNIRKMGSMRGMRDTGRDQVNGKSTTSNVTILPVTGNNSNMIIYLANAEDGIHRVISNQGFSNSNYKQIYNLANPDLIWKSEIVIQGNNKNIVYVGSYNKSNINSETESKLITGGLNEDLKDLAIPPKDMRGISGLLFASNYLFVYGANGLVQWSKLKDPLDFSNSLDRSISVGNEQVVDAKSIRGGTNSPTILFWTLTTLVRCINTPDAAGNLQFQIDVMSKDTSILSSRCVVEHRGVFFWPGTENFFQYNGIADDLVNLLSLNYFYDNLDMERRQQVVGVKNPKYSEIWWFYPEKANSPMRDPNIPAGENSRAIIYNIRDNTWYDTAISRSAAFCSKEFGFMASYGLPMSTPTTNNSALFRHEYEYLTVNPYLINEDFISNTGAEIIRSIPSTFTTPVFSWAAFNPMKQLTGTDRWMLLITIEPDFILLPAVSDLKVIINSKQYAQNIALSSDPFNIPSLNDPDPLIGKIDTAFQGRHMTLTFTSDSSNFEMGHVMLSLGLGDGK
jgi:hypothetical protein